MASGDTKTEQMLNVLANGGDASQFSGCCNTKTQDYILGAIDRIQSVEDEVDELKNNPDVVDIVDTYADLQAYDTQHLTNNDIIRVLQDETHSNNSTYYRFTKNPDTWTFIGEISGGSSVNVVQTTGTSTTDVMSQDATTDMIYSPKQTSPYDNWGAVYIGNKDSNNNVFVDPSNSGHSSYFYALPYQTSSTPVTPQNRCVCILGNSSGIEGISIGMSSSTAQGGVVIGSSAHDYSIYGVALGYSTEVSGANYSVALGAYSKPTRAGEVNVGTGVTSAGFNSTQYRVIGGVHDGIDAHDAATKGQLDAVAPAVFYVNSLYFTTHQASVILYTDSGLATAATIQQVFDAVSSGKPVTVIARSASEADYSSRMIFSMITAICPKVCTDNTMDEVGMNIYFTNHVNNTKIALGTFTGPTYEAEFSVDVS